MASAPPPNADERRLVREYNALLRGVAIDVRIPGGECSTLPRRTRPSCATRGSGSPRPALAWRGCRTATTVRERDWTRGWG